MFFIIEAGARIHTPLDSLLRPQGVQPLEKPAGVRRVEEQESASGRGRTTLQEQAYRDSRQYQDRHPVVFAREIMSAPVVTGRVDQSLDEVWRLFAERRIHHLPLLDGGQQLQGIVSDRDILRYAANMGRANTAIPIGQLMSRRVISATVDAEVRVVAEVMVTRGIGALVLLEEQGELAGIVTRSDILKTLVHRAPLDLWS